MRVTFSVLKLGISNNSNLEHSINILYMLITLEVLKLDKFNEVNELQE